MRKMSKSRGTDDDVVSSTNGSVLANEESPDHNNDENGKDKSIEDVDDNDSAKKTPKKGKSKRGRKRKAEKEDKEEIASEEEYEVDKVIDSKKIKGKLHYLIRWKGYSADSDTWEPENTLSCPELIEKFNNEENSKSKDNNSTAKKKSGKKSKKGKKESKSPAKRPKTEWDSEAADEHAEYEVERILEVHHKKNGKREFLIHWKGWSNKFDSWEPESNLNCSDLINKFMDKVSAARSTDSRQLRVAPGTTNRFTLQAPSSGRRLSKRRGQSQRVRYDDAE